ncbi:MAG: hypothetical protein K0R92_383 [Lachnospiraceae bacterium]|nr:hypothetical protein [Lachnospiraceae bacterium]
MAYEHYYFNDNTDDKGRHEVHTGSCSYIPATQNRTYIGYKSSCSDAIEAAKSSYPSYKFDGCYWCCRPCHKG